MHIPPLGPGARLSSFGLGGFGCGVTVLQHPVPTIKLAIRISSGSIGSGLGLAGGFTLLISPVPLGQDGKNPAKARKECRPCGKHII